MSHQLAERRFAVNGTPSDCVNLGVLGFLPERPALVASGINHGSNLGDDVTYSGTVSAAMEGTLLGVPSIAVSCSTAAISAAAGRAARLVAMRILVEGLPPKTLLNVNVPADGGAWDPLHAPGASRVQREDRRAGRSARTHALLARARARREWEALDGTDMGAVHEGFVAVTPVHLDLTNHRALALMADWSSALDAQWRRPPAAKAPSASKPARRARPRRR